MPVTIKSQAMTVREFLDQIVLKQMRAAYQVREDKIVITSRKTANKDATTGTP